MRRSNARAAPDRGGAAVRPPLGPVRQQLLRIALAPAREVETTDRVKWIPFLALVLGAAALPASVAVAAGGAATATRRCRAIPFTPNSDDIEASGVSCRAARRFIRAVGGNVPRRFRGYRCVSKALDSAPPSTRYRCAPTASSSAG